TQKRRTRARYSSFESQQIVSEPQPDSRGDQRAQERQRHSFERDRIVVKIPEAVHPVTRLREVRPVTTAREEPVVCGVAEQESGEGPLHRENDAQKNHRERSSQQPVSPPFAANNRSLRGSILYGPGRAREQPLDCVNGRWRGGI